MRCHGWLRLAACVWLVGVGAAFVAPPVLGQPPPHRAGLVIRHGSGEVFTACVEFAEAELSGLQLLQRAGVDLNIDASSTGATVCRLRGEGCSVPQQACFCQCEGPTCTYWSYWRSGGGGWQYSNLGAGSSVVRPGEVDGWVWGPGAVDNAGQPPPLTFAEVCAAATATSTATSTAATLTPTSTPVPAAGAPSPPPPTSLPAATFTPPPTLLPPSAGGGPPVIELFAADRAQLAPGESTRITWRVANAASVLLRAGDQAAPVDAAGTTNFAPPASVELWLEASNSSGTARSAVRLEVAAPEVAAPLAAIPAGAPPTPPVPPAPPLPSAPTVLLPAAAPPVAAPPLPPAGTQNGNAGAAAAPFRLALPVVLAGAAPATAAPAIAAPVTTAPVTTAPVTAMPVTAMPVTAIPVTAIPVTAIPVTAMPVTAGIPSRAGLAAASLPDAPQTAAPLPVAAAPESLPGGRQDGGSGAGNAPTPPAPGAAAVAAPGSLAWLALGLLLLPLGAAVAGMLLWQLGKRVFSAHSRVR